LYGVGCEGSDQSGIGSPASRDDYAHHDATGNASQLLRIELAEALLQPLCALCRRLDMREFLLQLAHESGARSRQAAYRFDDVAAVGEFNGIEAGGSLPIAGRAGSP
jgi:hypothetical protein